MNSALYRGHVMHQRVARLRHAFRYPIFMPLLDLDELGALDRSLRLFGYNRAAVVAYWDKDHFKMFEGSTRERLAQFFQACGETLPSGPVRLLTHPRILGYTFNPVSFFYCFAPDGHLAAVVAEVNNTYGERHVYVLPGDTTAQVHKKEFHVSPFFGLEGSYRFEVGPPGEALRVGVALTVGAERRFDARLALTRKRLSDGALLGMLARYPVVTAQVMAAIHWEALRLWWKGVPFRDKPVYAPESARQTQP